MKIKLDPGAKMPTSAHEKDAGFDLYAAESAMIRPYGRRMINTGVHMAIPEGYVGLVTSKSGRMVHDGFTCRGTIDSGYTGAVQAIVFNHTSNYLTIVAGEKVTQIVIVPFIKPELELTDELEETDRGDGGFGSTGNK